MLPLERVDQALICSLDGPLFQYSISNESEKSFHATTGSNDTTESNENLFFATENTHILKPLCSSFFAIYCGEVQSMKFDNQGKQQLDVFV
jgi:hypothetical protein